MSAGTSAQLMLASRPHSWPCRVVSAAGRSKAGSSKPAKPPGGGGGGGAPGPGAAGAGGPGSMATSCWCFCEALAQCDK